MRPGRTRKLQAGLTVTVAAFAAAVAHAQSPNSPVTGRLTLQTTADYNTNPTLAPVSPGGTLGLSESLGFSVRSETSTQLLDLSLSGSLSASLPAGGTVSTSFTSPRATLRYTRNAANGDLSLDGSYQSVPVSGSYLADPLNPLSVIVDSGTLTTSSATFSANVMQNAPLSFGVNASLDIRDYAGTTNPALFDETTTSLGGTANLRLSPVTQAAVSISQTNYVSGDPFGTAYVQQD